MSDYATVQDIQNLKRPLDLAEQTRAGYLIPIVCSLIRFEAKKTGRDYDQMIFESELVSLIDTFTGNGEGTEFNLSYVPCNAPIIAVNGVVVASEDYSISNNVLTFNNAPTGEIWATYDYRALAEVAKAVVCDVVIRELNTPSMQVPATSYSESAGSVSHSYSLPNASGAIKLWNSDLKALGLKRQKIDVIDLLKGKKG
jgi:hypothetical protein